MPTGHERVEAALRRIGRLGSGETATAAELADGVSEANRMLDVWSAKIGPIHSETTEALTWAAGQASRTIGTGGSLDTSRPQQILQASITVDSIEHPIDVITHQAYQAKTDKTLTSTIPYELAYNPTFATGRGTLFMYPIPSGALTLNLTSLKPLTAIVGASSALFPPGYDDAFVLNLAVRFADGEFAATIPQSLRDLAVDALVTLERLNDITEEMQPDPMTPGLCGGSWNPITDDI